MTETERKIAEMIKPVLDGLGYGLVRALLYGGERLRLQIMAERLDDAPMGVEECAAISREVSAHLDKDDPIDSAYTLEVSSPGIDRPLTRPEDFDRFKGRAAKMELTTAIDGRKRFAGRVLGLDGENVLFYDEESGKIVAPFVSIARAKLCVQNDRPLKKGKKEKK